MAMNKSLLFFFMINLLYLNQVFSQEQIVEGTYSNRGTGTYHKMLNYDTSPYEDYYLANANGGFLINFRLLKPNGFDPANTQKKYPLILMMHGVGESGWHSNHSNPAYLNNDYQLLWGGKEHIAAVNRDPMDPRAFPGFVLFPQNNRSSGRMWVDDERDAVIKTIELLIEQYNVDPTRIYVHGLSGGAQSVWKIINMRPDLFAAALPMSGVPNPGTYDYESMVHIPIWLFQGEVDKDPPLQRATNVINNLTNAGGTPRFYVYPGVGHSTWNRAYGEPDFFSWMLGYSKLSIHVYHGKNEFCPEDEVNARLGISPGPGYNYEWSKDDV